MNGGSSRRFPTVRRRVALASAVVMVATLLQAVAQPAVAADDGRGRPALPASEKPVPVSAAKSKARTLMKEPRTPRSAPEMAWPKEATAEVELPADGTTASLRAEGLPLTLGAGTTSGRSKAGGTVEARVLSREAARNAGVAGPMFSLRAQNARERAKPVRVRARLDYSGFTEAFGGGYGSRLTLVELPACALTTPSNQKCRTSRPVATVNDTETRTLTAKSVTVDAASSTVLAAVAEASGGNGDYTATSLAPSATWSTNLNTGDFAWSYGMPVPDVPGGLTPSVGLAYSSGSVDGRTGNTNNQASWAGDGFGLWPGFIERRYKPCADDDVKNADGGIPGDLCWAYDNAFLTFNGKGGELVPEGGNSWKLKDDDGTKIDHLTSSNRGNGDDDGEYWRLTDPDGTRYYFGYHRLPGWAEGKEATDSTWTVPVFGNNSEEPCHAATFADSWCQQAWRWNLDYAVDVHGNAIAYYYDQETNSYGRNLKAADNTRYVRGGTVDRIEYGLKSSSMYGTKALGKVTFTNGERCLPDSRTTCSSITSDSAYWYDTPWDLNCDSGKDCDKGRVSPSFFTRKRLTQITAQVYDSSGYKDIDSWKLTHHWGKADTDYQLLLDSIQHTGHADAPAVTLPKTTFVYTQLANRLDRSGDGYAPFIKGRLSTVADEAGGQIDVNYSAEACDWNALPTPQTNTTRCFPQYIGGSSSADPDLTWFNKYVVSNVALTDRTGGSPDQVTMYDYLDGAAWHYENDDGFTEEKSRTWSQWRGYGHVRVRTGGQGGSSAMKSQADTYFLRGMNGDRKDASGGTKSVVVALGTDEGDSITDHESAAGFAYKTVDYSGPNGKILSKTVNRPWYHETASKTRDWGTITANLTGTARSRSWTSLDDGAGAEWRITMVDTEHDTVAGRVTQVHDRGDVSKSSDNTCTRTTYATPTAPTTPIILTLPSRVEAVAKACDATVSRPDDVMSDVRTAYDGDAYDVAPTKGDATASAALTRYDGTTAVYAESGTTYDSYGRELTSTDLTADVKVAATGGLTRTARTDGRTVTTARIPATGLTTSVKVTTPPATVGDGSTAQTTTTTYDSLRGLPLTRTDTNGEVTEFAYDALGRSTKVWLADRLTGQTPTYEFTYTVTDGKPIAVGTKTIGNRGVQRTSYVFYDGFLRARQSQDPGPDGGSLLTDTFYDERGLIGKQFATYYTERAPSTVLLKPEEALGVETQSRYTYDGLGRRTEGKQIAGNGDGGTVLSTTQTIYGGDRTTVIPPVGGTATTTLTDARGQTTQLRQHHTRSASAAYDTTTYSYTPRGELKELTDPAGTAWTYMYDLLGQVTQTTDPDKGTTFSKYDDRGQLVSMRDARKDSPALWYVYDNLGRRTEVREGSASGTLRSKWVYDTISGAKGYLAQATRYQDGNAYTSKVVAYDHLYRPLRTSVTIPASEGALAGTYLSGTTYNVSGTVQGVGYPAAGSLSATTGAYTYEDDTLRPTEFSVGPGVVSRASYSLTGKPLQYELSRSGGLKTWATNTWEWGTQRLATSRVDRENVPGVDQYSTYRYDEAGNVLSVSDVSRSGTDNQCFAYDYLRRLTEAWTQNTTSCAAAPSGSALGGPAPYWSSYGYDVVGNRTTETLHNTAGDASKDTERTYEYPGAGAAQPHILSSVTTKGPTGTAKNSYGYDETGNTITRTLGGDTRTLKWDPEGHLAKVTEPVEGGTDKVTEYVYDTDGNRLIGRTPTETTLYLGATEITLPKGTTTPKGTRYFDLGGGHQAVQQNDGTVSFTLADHHGTAQLAIDTATQSLTQRRALPFGGTRGTEPAAWPGGKGFVGGNDDTKSTGLTHLGAREYDPSIGRFISVDPLLVPDSPQSLNGYSYGSNNPVTTSDPDGTCPYIDCPTRPTPQEQNTTPGHKPRPRDDSANTTAANNGWSYRAPSGKSTGARHSGGAKGSTDNQPRIGGVRVPTEKELQASQYVEASYSQNLMLWADNLCRSAPRSAFCDAAHALGWTVPQGDILELVGVRDALRCKNGSATACVWTVAGFLPVKFLGKAAKLFLRGESAADVARAARASCLVHSFVPGTEVLLDDGTTKPIEDVAVGDKITVTDPDTGETTTREVVATIVTEDDKDFVDLAVATPGDPGAVGSLIATTTHPFWSPSQNSWVDAGELRAGMTLRTPKGQTAEITTVRQFTKRQTTHDLTISDIHTYYVLAGETPVLVHNSGPGCGSIWIDSNKVPHHFKHAEDFGITGKESKATKQAFVNALGSFVRNPGNVQVTGTYRGAAARHYVDPNTGRHVSVDLESGQMLGAWRSDPTSNQFRYLMEQGKL
ncbi:RHS repeat-associated core domain-containing protein [Streptomyces griseoviridis]